MVGRAGGADDDVGLGESGAGGGYDSHAGADVTDVQGAVGGDSQAGEALEPRIDGGTSVARALAVEPEFIICDEAVSALDVSIQAQVINLLEDLRDEFDLTYLFISHDLSVVHHLCHRVAVMYLGHMVELAETEELFHNPLHPYTQALLEAVPIPDPTVEKARAHTIIKGEIPSPINPPSGCVFHPRCPKAVAGCKVNMPEFREVKPGHWVACTEV